MILPRAGRTFPAAILLLLLLAGPARAEGAGGNPTGATNYEKIGGTVGVIIIVLSTVALAFTIEHLLTIRRSRLIPDWELEDLDKLVKARRIDEAIKYCESQPRPSLLTAVVHAGLTRFRSSEYGFAEYRAAVEEAGEEQTNRLYRKTEVLSIIGAIAPMLGLLGTVQGMIEAFNTIASTSGAAKPGDLAGAISIALVTTFEGLVVAIPTLTVLSFFRTRIDSLVAEAGSKIEQLLTPLSRPK
jgi:biopolymer transport protein ExbB